jgi:hypothetical protein
LSSEGQRLTCLDGETPLFVCVSIMFSFLFVLDDVVLISVYKRCTAAHDLVKDSNANANQECCDGIIFSVSNNTVVGRFLL